MRRTRARQVGSTLWRSSAIGESPTGNPAGESMRPKRSRTIWIAAAATCAFLVLLVAAPGRALELPLTLAGACLVVAACRSSFSVFREARHASDRPEHFQLAQVYRGVVEALASAIAAKDSYASHEASRVQRIAEVVARRLHLDAGEVEGIRTAALLRDIGKLGIPDHILLKPGPLDPDEFSKVRNHAAIGAEILANVDSPWDLAAMVRHHHERYDGTGYPDRLVAEQIPVGSRIIHVAEVYDALISERCYRKGWSHQQAMDHIEGLAGSHFDPAVVAAFLEMEPQIAQLSRQDAEALCCDPAASGSCAAADVISQANRELVSLFEIARTLSSTLETDELVALLAHRTRRLLQAATCIVLVRDENDPRTLTARAAVGRHQEVLYNCRARVGRGFTGRAASRQRTAVANCDISDLEFAREAPSMDLKCCAVAPIVSFGEVLGTINVYGVCPNAFSDDDLRVLSFVAHQAALAIENASSFERVRDTAMRDPLTNLHNGRYLCANMERELSRAGRLGEPLSVVGIDLDNFKSVNDTCGHGVGDKVLKDVADIFRRHLREYDVAVRHGGDEFVVILPETSAAEASRTAKRIQREIDAYARHSLADAPVGLGASVGVASYPGDATDAQSLLAQADAAMYRDKRDRRTRILAA